MNPKLERANAYQRSELAIVSRGETIEHCFVDAALQLFTFMIGVSDIHLIQIINFEFEETDINTALVTWLNLLLKKTKEHHLMCGDFRLKREGSKWRAIIAGEPWRNDIKPKFTINNATLSNITVNKINHLWEARFILLL